ncbi:hypothetical protein OIU77_010425 [Salix suchowensis]|uniref:BACK domain-containing protein n=1 Tax=Salix suchowensis TaxID=1278906 RepID=A0ABQ9A8A5_9ROSI|nr:hypothetical protein OIU77_010425 [Salix suchowensis]
MMKGSNSDLFDPRTEMDSDSMRGGSASDGDFGFAFNDSNFSDRLLRIEIMGGSAENRADGEGCTSIIDWARHRKRRREDIKKDNNNGDLCVGAEEQILGSNQPDIDDCVVGDNQDEEGEAMVEVSHSDDETGDGNESSWSMDCSTVLFSNGMRESEQRHVTLRINASEEAALMELLNFMYSNALTASQAPQLLDVLMAADKFEVASCMRYCSRQLRNLSMTPESALLYLELPSSVLMAEAVQPLTDAAKQYLAARYKDMTKFHEEVMALPLAGIEAILSSDDLQVASEDAVYDFVLKWARVQYPRLEERREVLGARLARYIRFPYMTCRKLKKVLTCTDFEHDAASKLVLEALFFKGEPPHRQRTLAAEESATSNRRFVERAYKYRPVKVVEFELPRQQCVVYLDLKREECTNLFPSGRVYSQAFHLGGQGFFLVSTLQHGPAKLIPLLRAVPGDAREGIARSKPTEEFVSKYKGNYTFTGGKAVGYRNLFAIPWTSFMAEDSLYFINGVLHLRAELTIRQ